MAGKCVYQTLPVIRIATGRRMQASIYKVHKDFYIVRYREFNKYGTAVVNEAYETENMDDAIATAHVDQAWAQGKFSAQR